MEKLKLDFESIRVESFDTSPAGSDGRGTVHGQTGYTDCAIQTGTPCQNASTFPCQAGTYAGDTCDSTQWQINCTCTAGGDYNGTCDVNATCNYQATCAYQTGCYLYCE